MDDRRLGVAATRWSDYVGTAAADDAEVRAGDRSLYELAGLDRDRWLIAAVDVRVRSGDPSVVVYAIDRSANPDHPLPYDVEDLIAEHGSLPVTAIPLPADTTVQAFLNEAFRRVSIRLVARGFRDDLLVVHDRGPAEQ